ncbi:MAG: ParB/RepB/Spo0J family partition protein [Parolsenella sp.]|uniref:ParB/RepB/Spo0J family partition protein n=1 Tax=Parolsenella sp. TaxID=2083006 RepID=UPI002A74D427|nr:ParB/RepB/Spo0J family partition protein [Parolsenella sp.]MDY3291321.1 ParB/RepB/Spo0J family partition protein [Parolsenella sp.]
MVKKAALGKGLNALFTETAAESGSEPEASLPIASIVTNPDQPRKSFDETQLSELSDSIKQNGVLQPILVRKKGEKYEIVAGERRYQASKLAGLKEIPAIVREIDDAEVFQLALIENLQRSDLTPIEEARGYRQLLDTKGLTQEGLAKILSKSRSAIANTLRLIDLPQEVQDMMEEGQITAGHARAILAVPSEEGRIKLAQKVVAENLTVRQTENLAPLFSVTRDEIKPKNPAPQYFKRAARTLRQALDTTVKVKQVRGKNKIEIEFKDEDDLARIIDQLSSGSQSQESSWEG